MSIHLRFKILNIIAFVALGLNTLAQETSYIVKGTAGQLNHPAKAYLMYSSAAGRQIDSANIYQGKFIFKGISDQPRPAVLYVSKTGAGLESSGHDYVLFYLESGSIEIKSSNTLDSAIVAGGPINTDNDQLNIALRENNAEFKKLREAYAAVSSGQNNEKEVKDSIAKRSEALLTTRKSIYFTFIKKHPASMMSLFALKNYERPVANVADIEPIFYMLSADIRESIAGKSYAAEIARMKHIEIGSVAPDFTLTDPSGKTASLHDYKGKYILIDFWASWCSPCRADNPNVVKIYSAFKDKGLIVLSVSLDDVKSKWLNAIQEDKLPWLQLSDLKAYNPGGIAKLYSLDSIPQNFLIGPDGKIIERATTTIDLPGKLKDLLK
jgi:peroxiredoxin